MRTRRPLAPERELIRTLADVHQQKAGMIQRLFIVCGCGSRHYLGTWGAAHVGITEIVTTCNNCRARITIERDEPRE